MKEILASLISIIDSEENLDKKMEMLNLVKIECNNISPMKHNPVDCVLWVLGDKVRANDYNPNTVAPPEMELLATSIREDGYTQPIVTWSEDDVSFEVVDGFHRNRVAKEVAEVRERLFGYLPVVRIKASQSGKCDRISSTIRHNRARGKHNVEAMSDIVIELARRNWNDEKIAKNLGMDSDEVLRLKQITGIADMFKDEDFSNAWIVEGEDEELEENLEEL